MALVYHILIALAITIGAYQSVNNEANASGNSTTKTNIIIDDTTGF